MNLRSQALKTMWFPKSRKSKPRTTSEVADLLGVSRQMASHVLMQLRHDGMIRSGTLEGGRECWHELEQMGITALIGAKQEPEDMARRKAVADELLDSFTAGHKA